ncbi:MAG: hypothetical protein HRT95_04005 [Moritella sp.]|uniref:RAQPRD family integrative conjugative element protein n=1 Tax=Moritella sp. TaxID=78556 RepID=UPI001D3FB9ED|nr:RAQPRD family integrative conjugative element protein [Moritella sp.]NQZ49368.1 hypothetical protein [Moritella sp.]
MKKILALALTLSFVSAPLSALTWEEAEYLNKLKQHLGASIPIAERASAAASSGRVQFKYGQLKADLEEMQRLIEQHLNSPQFPRSLTDLTLSYSSVIRQEE